MPSTSAIRASTMCRRTPASTHAKVTCGGGTERRNRGCHCAPARCIFCLPDSALNCRSNWVSALGRPPPVPLSRTCSCLDLTSGTSTCRESYRNSARRLLGHLHRNLRPFPQPLGMVADRGDILHNQLNVTAPLPD